MYRYQSLENTKISNIHEAFLEAFSDYVVPMKISLEQFQRLLKRRGYQAQNSVGVFQDDQLIGFVLTSTRQWQGLPTTYVIGLGLSPRHRGHGLAKELMQQVTLLNKPHTQQFLLEVITSNQPALKLYQSLGYQISRELLCFSIPKANLTLSSSEHIDIKTSQCAPDDVSTFWDKYTSWQYSKDTLATEPNYFVYVTAYIDQSFVGYGVIDPISGDIYQLAVHPEHRRQGIASAILSTLCQQTESSKIGCSNIDISNESLIAFLQKQQFKLMISQYEMHYSL
jgi:ribosomal protein S18 acetylase RimI-like enzyme